MQIHRATLSVVFLALLSFTPARGHARGASLRRTARGAFAALARGDATALRRYVLDHAGTRGLPGKLRWKGRGGKTGYDKHIRRWSGKVVKMFARLRRRFKPFKLAGVRIADAAALQHTVVASVLPVVRGATTEYMFQLLFVRRAGGWKILPV